MFRRAVVICAAAFLITQCSVRAQSAAPDTGMSVSEFRQVLLDLGSYLDARKGTNLHQQFESLTDDGVKLILSSISNPGRLETAVAALKRDGAGQTLNATARMARPQPEAAFPACSANTIIDNSPGAACTPAYPDPNNSSWRAMVNPLITFGAFSPTDYASVSPQACGLTTEVNLQQVTVALQGAVNSITPGCSIIPAPLNAACFGPLIAIAAADSVSAGLFSDCVEQDGLVNAAEIDAGFHNTVTIYNSLNTGLANLNTHITNVNNQITGEFSALDTHLTNVDTHIAAEFTALSAQLTSLFTQLTNQVSQTTALMSADMKQVMKLLMTPDGQKIINPAILTCTGANCPDVLAACAAAGCSWNRVGPLP
jgi:hypothetical protein